MLTETAVSAILTASITGAGLVMAVYALMSPISKRVFQDRVDRLRKKKEQFEKIMKGISAERPEGIKQLRALADEIKQIRTFPRYLGPLVLLAFALYIMTSVYCMGWMNNPSQRGGMNDQVLGIMFLVSTFVFLAVGMYTIIDVYWAMKSEFEQMKKEKEEVEKASEEFEKLKERVEEVLYEPVKEDSRG